jgi:hypothetical protein
MIEVVKMEKKGYGYSIDEPVKAFSTFGSYDYLNSLKPKNGIMVRWVRDHSEYSEKLGHMIDEYFVFVLSMEEPIQMKRYSIFIDMYHRMTDKEKPEDFE